MAFGNSRNVVPEGQNENSPAFQRRDMAYCRTRPAGTAEIMRSMSRIQPSLRDSAPSASLPGVETPGYFREVPPGLRRATETQNFRKTLRLNADFELRLGKNGFQGLAGVAGGAFVNFVRGALCDNQASLIAEM